MLKRGMSVHDHMGNSPGDTPLYGLGMCGLKGYGSNFGHKYSIDLGHFSLK